MSFYALVWRLLPGPFAVKAVVALLLAVAVVAVLFSWVFPMVATVLPFNENTVGA